jgi:hypothetical protein
MLLGKGVMINWTNVVPADRPAYDAWQCREHMPGRVAIPGFLRGRRYIEAFPLSFPGPAHREFLTLYEVNDLSVLTGADYLAKANSPSPLTLKTTPVVRDSIRGLSHVRASLGEGMGGAALTLRFDPLGGSEDKLERFLTSEALPACAERYNITGAHFIVADQTASGMKPVERQGRPTDYPNWVVMLEGTSAAAVCEAARALLPDSVVAAHGGSAPARDCYQLQFTHLNKRAFMK